jgi:hypothetical protein
MRTRTLLTLAVAASLAGCGGGSTTPSAPSSPSPGGASPASYSEQSISTANALGTSVKTVAEFEKGITPASKSIAGGLRPMSASTMACTNGFMYLVPDSNGDLNSTEAKYYYDSACTQLARDIVRIFTPATQGASSATELVSVTESQYAQGNSSAIATRTESVEYTAPSTSDFDSNGYPRTSAGYQRTANDLLTLAGSSAGQKTIASSSELVMTAAAAPGQNAYCSDSAQFNMTGIPSLNETFGSAGGVGNGSRTVNADGSVTWSGTHAGTSYKGAIGSLSIVTGSTPNAACPLSAPLYTLAGGTSVGAYSIPVNATFMHGLLTSLTVTGAQLANGNTLNITSSGTPASSSFVTGTISNGAAQIATFTCDAFGDGTLTVTKNGTQYVMQDWHVVH